MDYIDRYKNSSDISSRLMNHTLGVIETGKELARIYAESVPEIEIACLYHDYAKEWDIEKLNAYVKQYQLGEDLIDNKNISHGKVAAHYLKNNWTKELPTLEYSAKVIDGISYHTTGKAEMSLFEMIVYVADAIEPTRTYEGIEEIRAKSKVEIKEAFNMILLNTVKHLESKSIKKEDIHEDTIKAIEWLKDKI